MFLIFGLGVGGDSTVYAADPLLTSPDFEEPSYPISNYTWDADGLFGRFDPIYGMANLIFLIGVFLARLSMWVLNLGYAPSEWLAPFQAISDAIQKSHFLDHLWPFFAIVAGGVQLRDLAQHNIQRMMQRGVMFLIVLVSLLLFKSLGTVQYIKMVTSAIDALSYATSGWVLTFDQPVDPNKPQLTQASNNIDKEIWNRLVDYPWQLGEIGTPGKVLGKKDAESVQGIVGGDMSVSASTPWRDVLLHYGVGTDKRKDLAGILNSDDHSDSKAAFASPYRLTLALFALIAQLCAVVYMFTLGVMMNMAYLLYLAAMLAGIVILPLAIIPWDYSHSLLRWWVKGLSGSIVVRLGLSLFVGLTFLAIKIFTPNVNANDGSAIGSMLLYAVFFVFALWVLSRLWKRMQPIQRLTRVASAPFPAFAESGGGAYSNSHTPPSSLPDNGDSSSRRIDPDRQGDDLPSLREIWGKRKPGMGQALRKAGWKALRGDIPGAAASLTTDVAKEIVKGSGETLKVAGEGYYDIWKATGGVSGESLKIAKDMLLKGRHWKNKQEAGTSHQADAATGQEGQGNEERRNTHRPIDPDRLNWEGRTPESQDPAYWESLLREDLRRPLSQDVPRPHNADDGLNLNHLEPLMASQDPNQGADQSQNVREVEQPDQESTPSAEMDQAESGRETSSVGLERRLFRLGDTQKGTEDQARAVNPDADQSGAVELSRSMGAEEHVLQQQEPSQQLVQNEPSETDDRQLGAAEPVRQKRQEVPMPEAEPAESNAQRINADRPMVQAEAHEGNRSIAAEQLKRADESQDQILRKKSEGVETTDLTEKPTEERQQASSGEYKERVLIDHEVPLLGDSTPPGTTPEQRMAAEDSGARMTRLQREEPRTVPTLWRDKTDSSESDRSVSFPSRKAPALRSAGKQRNETAEVPNQVLRLNPDDTGI
jgi:hypothetical protein